jgi:hypothetical protein
MDNVEAYKVLKELLERGHGILRHQPVARETCDAWTRAAREGFAAIWGVQAAELKELAGARRKIMTNFDTDPSYYLTQVVANLHREIKVIDKYAKQKEEAAREQGASVKNLPKFAALVWVRDGADAANEVAAALAKGSLEPHIVAGGGDLLGRVMALPTLRYGVVVAPAGADGGVASEAAYAMGCLAGRLGASRVVVLLDGPAKLPGAMQQLRAFGLSDAKRWQSELAADAPKMTR